MRLCACGCGNPVKKESHRYLFGHNSHGICNPSYNGGLWIEKRSGRCYIHCRNGHGYPYYRGVMEGHLKRALDHKDIVHHINGDPTDDRIENLQLIPWGEHSSLSNKKYDRAEMVSKLIEFFDIYKKKPTMKIWNQLKLTPNVKTYQVYFGSWNNALKEAGLLCESSLSSKPMTSIGNSLIQKAG